MRLARLCAWERACRRPSRCPGIGERERWLPAAYAGATKHTKNVVKIGSRVSVRGRRGAGDQATFAHFLWQTVRRGGADLISDQFAVSADHPIEMPSEPFAGKDGQGCRDP